MKSIGRTWRNFHHFLTSRAFSNTVKKSSWVGCCFSVFPDRTDMHRCSSSPSLPLHPYSRMTNSFHSVIRATTEWLHSTHYLALLSFPAIESNNPRIEIGSCVCDSTSFIYFSRILGQSSKPFSSLEEWTQFSFCSLNLLLPLCYNLSLFSFVMFLPPTWNDSISF